METWANNGFASEQEAKMYLGACQTIKDIVEIDYFSLTGKEQEDA